MEMLVRRVPGRPRHRPIPAACAAAPPRRRPVARPSETSPRFSRERRPRWPPAGPRLLPPAQPGPLVRAQDGLGARQLRCNGGGAPSAVESDDKSSPVDEGQLPGEEPAAKKQKSNVQSLEVQPHMCMLAAGHPSDAVGLVAVRAPANPADARPHCARAHPQPHGADTPRAARWTERAGPEVHGCRAALRCHRGRDAGGAAALAEGRGEEDREARGGPADLGHARDHQPRAVRAEGAPDPGCCLGAVRRGCRRERPVRLHQAERECVVYPGRDVDDGGPRGQQGRRRRVPRQIAVVPDLGHEQGQRCRHARPTPRHRAPCSRVPPTPPRAQATRSSTRARAR